ncbi:hypothetical protein GCM10020254_41080 [Streptomyces goshikiensis]
MDWAGDPVVARVLVDMDGSAHRAGRLLPGRLPPACWRTPTNTSWMPGCPTSVSTSMTVPSGRGLASSFHGDWSLPVAISAYAWRRPCRRAPA